MTANALSTKPERNPGIDLLRGLSILLVVIHHVGLRIPLKSGVLATFLPRWFLNALIYNGYEAVFVFFVISGFLITTNTLQRWGSLAAIDTRSFYARRAGRILPTLLLLIAVLSLLHLAGAKDYLISHANQSLPRTILSALGLHLNWYEGQTGWLPGNWDVLWSLSIEEVFYLAFPLVCLGLRRDRVLVPALVLLALSLPVSRAALNGNPIWQEKAYLPGMAAIATGVLAAWAAARYPLTQVMTTRLLAALGSLGLVAVLCFEGGLWRILGNGTLLVLTISTALLVVAFHAQATHPMAPSFRGTGWLRSFGRLSYEIYLTHMFVVWPVIHAFKAMGARPWYGILWYVPVVALSWVLGWLVARMVSGPAERFLRQRMMAAAS
ncbi:MAG TPA: acyltransferase [Geothrix sp.]|nr:acyltransferase [Geothrix sp.]